MFEPIHKFRIYVAIIFGAFAFSGSFALGVNIKDINIHSKTHIRWIPTELSYPYHSAVASDLIAELKSTNNLSIKYRLTFENPSISNAYLEHHRLFGRMSASTFKEFNHLFINKATLQVGYLDRTTAGQGLTLKDFESAGFKFGLECDTLDFGLTYIGHGYALAGDYALFNLDSKNKDWGIQWFAYFNDENYFSTHASRISFYGLYPINSSFRVKYEIGTATDHSLSDLPVAALISPELQWSNENTEIQTNAVVRSYSSGFNRGFSQFNFSKKHYFLEEEAFDFDNWRTYLLNTQTSNEKVTVLGARTKLKQKIFTDLWIISDLEFNRQIYPSATIDTTLYFLGIQYDIEKDKQMIYLGYQNKILNSKGVIKRASPTAYRVRDEYPISNNPIVSEVDPFLVIGVRFSY